MICRPILILLPCLALCLTPIALALAEDKKAEEKKIEVREIDLSDVPAAIVKGKPTEPKVITSAEELAKVFTDQAIAGRIKKAVDFEKEKLVYFAWSGSGQDEITFSIEKADEGQMVMFHYLAGRTRDLRGHQKLFALPKDAAFKVALAR